ncbi:MAG: hypothetical protein JWN27_1673 [Candidatus Eremiobacteraeota bacterium]|nr:hypothetical protein [Candidatus Eremiobacteraeota bacterium]
MLRQGSSLSRAMGGTSLAVAIALVTFASGAGAATPVPSMRVEPVARPALDTKRLVTQQMAALAELRPRTIKALQAATRPVAPQDVRVAGRVGGTVTRPLDYCAQHPPEIDRVSGTVTPGGTLTIGGQCFGTSGTAAITGNFPLEPRGVNLLIESWTDTSVTARLFGNPRGGSWDVSTDSFTRAPDQAVALSVATHRTAGGIAVVGPSVVSPPVRLNFTARRLTIQGWPTVSSCAAGDLLDPLRPDICQGIGWGFTYHCGQLSCSPGVHLRKVPDSGEDVYAFNLHNGYALNDITMYGDAADLSIDPSLDPSHVTFRVRWRTVPKNDLAMVRMGHPQYANYHDGSYMFYARITGPDGASP